MAKYLLIESRDPFDSRDVDFSYGLAKDLADAGHDVALFLVQNGVLPARRGPSSHRLDDVAEAGVRILADDFSLKERGIQTDRLVPRVEPTGIETLVDALVEGRRPIWH